MRCIRCNKEINSDICPYCAQDNRQKLKPLSFDNLIIEKKKRKFNNIFVIVTFFSVILAIFIGYTIEDSKSLENDPKKTKIDIVEANTFYFIAFAFSYPNDFIERDQTLYYKNNEQINIAFKTISADEASEIINTEEMIDCQVGDIKSTKYIKEDYYVYLFTYQQNYYTITVNYPNNILKQEDLSNALERIVMSIKIK